LHAGPRTSASRNEGFAGCVTGRGFVRSPRQKKEPTRVGRWAVSSPQIKDVVGTVAGRSPCACCLLLVVGRVLGPGSRGLERPRVTAIDATVGATPLCAYPQYEGEWTQRFVEGTSPVCHPRDNLGMSAPARPRPAGFHAVHTPAVAPLGERELDELQSLLDRVPEPLEPLDASMLD